LSYGLLIGGALLVVRFIEKPCQRWIRGFMHVEGADAA